mgnify:CR=1 FL=1
MLRSELSREYRDGDGNHRDLHRVARRQRQMWIRASEELARDLDLYSSSGRSGTEEPKIFSEPGMLLVKPDQTLYFASIQSMPFTRPPLDELLKAIDSATANGFPARCAPAARGSAPPT